MSFLSYIQNWRTKSYLEKWPLGSRWQKPRNLSPLQMNTLSLTLSLLFPTLPGAAHGLNLPIFNPSSWCLIRAQFGSWDSWHWGAWLGVYFCCLFVPVQAVAQVCKAIQETRFGCILGRRNQSFSSFLAKGGTETGLGAGLLWWKLSHIPTVAPVGEGVGTALGLF